MNITLWFLNRITAWERDRPGVLAGALAPHDVRLGKRVVSAASGDDSRNLVQVAVNHSEDCFRGELMHEEYQQKLENRRTQYDEYFVPIPLKCLGQPDYSGEKPQLTAFWKQVIRPEKQAEFLFLFDPSLNHCFSRTLDYWKVQSTAVRRKKIVRDDSPLADEFGDVRMNTTEALRPGYYEILHLANQQHGKNVLIGYSQGGTVASYLAYIDEYFVRPEHRCILGVIPVQAPLRGATFAMHELQAHVLNTLVQAVRAIWGIELWRKFVPDNIRALTDPVLDSNNVQIDQVADLLDHLWVRTKDDERMQDFIKTARKWLSGLHNDPQLAFCDIDPVRLNTKGSVLYALQQYPLVDTYYGGVSGTNYHLEPLARSVLAYKSKLLGILGWLASPALHLMLRRAETIIREKTFDMMPVQVANPPLAGLHADWKKGADKTKWGILKGSSVPQRAHDFVIPSVSHLTMPLSDKFIGNCVNRNASHLSGAALNNFGRKDIYYVKALLKSIAVWGTHT